MNCHLNTTLSRLFIFAALLFLYLASPVWAETPQSIKVGATVPLTGPLAASGSHAARGLELAIHQLNERGGIKGRDFRLVVEDNAGEPKKAVSSAVKLLSADRVDIIFSQFTHLASAIQEPVKREGKIFFYAAAVKGIAQQNPLAFRDWGDAYSQGVAMAKEASRLGKKKVAIINEENEATKDFVLGFHDGLKSTEVKVVFEDTFLPEESDYRSALLKVAGTSPDLILLGAWRNSALILRQMKALGMIAIQAFEILGPLLPPNSTPEMLSILEENKTVSFWYDFGFDSPGQLQKDFILAFTNRFNEAPRIEAAFAYDDLMILAARAASCAVLPKLDLSCIAQGLRNSHWNGVAGQLSFGPDGLASREEILVEVKNGSWVKRAS